MLVISDTSSVESCVLGICWRLCSASSDMSSVPNCSIGLPVFSAIAAVALWLAVVQECGYCCFNREDDNELLTAAQSESDLAF